MVLNDPKSFSVDVKGESTQQQYSGVFKVRLLLTHRQKLQKDEMKRQLLGVAPENPSQDAFKTAIIFSKIWAHLVEAPSWWKDAGNGIDLLDEAPVDDVISKLAAMEEELNKSLSKEGDKAKEELTEIAKKTV